MSKPLDNTPISMWGYFGYQILFAIPLVGFIALIVCALAADNVNVRNFARSYFCVAIIALVIFGFVLALGGLSAIAGAVGSVVSGVMLALL